MGLLCLSLSWFILGLLGKTFLREVVKTTILKQDLPNPKIDGGRYLHSHSSTSKDVVFIA